MGREKLAYDWQVDAGHAWLLGSELEPLITEAIEDEDLVRLEELFDDLVERFAEWRNRFSVDGQGKPRYIEDSHGYLAVSAAGRTVD